jgi:LmbE family N-acetylglucosaminyl deacetylase
MALLLIVLFIIPFLWITGFLLVTDFAVPLRKERRLQRVLVIFPHADDEAISCGGFLRRISRSGCNVTLLILTKGERGIPRERRYGDFKEIRVKEAQKVVAILGIPRLIQEDFGDGRLSEQRQELTMFIAALIEQEQPDLLITYDLAGFYGHADHIMCSEIITELKRTRFPELPLWYVTFPKRVLTKIKLPTDLAIDPQFQEKQAVPTHKIYIGASVFPKIKSWYTYKSQRTALANGISRFAPVWLLWFFLSMVLFEYFAEVR